MMTSEDGAKQLKPLSMPALGRSARLGDLYDATSDQFILGINTFQNPLKPEEGDVIECKRPSLEFKHSRTNTLKEKLDHLKVSGEIMLSLMAGKFKIGGSASYLNDDKESAKEENFSVLVKTTTTYQCIPDIQQLLERKTISEGKRRCMDVV